MAPRCALPALLCWEQLSAPRRCDSWVGGRPSAAGLSLCLPGVLQISTGLEADETACAEQIYSSVARRFGPVTPWAQFNAVCKGACRAWNDRIARFTRHGGPGCSCAAMRDVLGYTYRCRNPVYYLCRHSGFCFDYAEYWHQNCQPDSCARWNTDENSWRIQKAKCGGMRHGWAGTVAAVAGIAWAWTAYA